MTEVNEPVVGHHRPVVSRSNTVALAMTVVVGTLLLLWGGDWLARQGAQSVLSQQVQDATGTVSSPAVRVHGFFFLPQVIAGRYDNVEIDSGMWPPGRCGFNPSTPIWPESTSRFMTFSSMKSTRW